MREVASGGWRVASGKWLVFCLAVVAGCFLCCTAWAFSICGSCGYENGDEARFCSHCGGAISGGQGADGKERRAESKERRAESKERKGESAQAEREVRGRSVPVQNGDASKSVINVASVKEEMRMAQKYARQGRIELGELFARNAFALNMLAGDDVNEGRSKAVLKFLKSCEVSSKSGRRRCPECSGSGKAVMSARGLGDRSVKIETASMRCKGCGGSGRINGQLNMDERKYRISTALEEYRTLQQSRGMKPEGLVWVPADSAEKIGLRDRVTLKRALPPVCAHCMGLGRDDCSTCNGRGIVECSVKGCRNGYVESESTVNRLGGSLRSEHSGGRSKCSKCRGTGVQSCTKCSGSGSFLCKSCSGSGRAEICNKCRGKGLNICRRCGGSGVYRDKACSYCQEMGSIECSSCGGTGRRQ